ncbi:MAG: beta-propeller fold lactonase family protein, partial [Candidatus Aminicenantales bacterium]
ATGALTAVSGSPYAVKTGPSSVAVDPSGKYVYVANYWSTNISAFSIKSTTGALTEITGSPFAGETNAGGNPAAIAVVRLAL